MKETREEGDFSYATYAWFVASILSTGLSLTSIYLLLGEGLNELLWSIPVAVALWVFRPKDWVDGLKRMI